MLYIFMSSRDLNTRDYVPAGIYTSLELAKKGAEIAEGEPLDWSEINGVMVGYNQGATKDEYAAAMIYYIHTVDQDSEIDKRRPDWKVRAVLNKGKTARKEVDDLQA